MRQASDQLHAPSGFLLDVVASTSAGRHADPATTIITAAAAAGLSWPQHVIDVHTPLDEHEPRAEADTAAATRARSGTVPVFTEVRSSKEEPDYAPAASLRVRRSPYPQPPWRLMATASEVTRPLTERVRRFQPISTRFELAPNQGGVTRRFLAYSSPSR